MTNRDVFIQILSEVTGKPSEQVNDLFDIFSERYPHTKMDEELSDEKAKELLCNLRKEKSGILAWLIKGAHMHAKNQ